jgi:hypothetical protein
MHRSVCVLALGACSGVEDDPCADYVGLVPREQVALSPRADAAAEGLALCIDGGLVATTPTYDRVVADLPALSALLPAATNTYGALYGDVAQSALVVCPTAPADWPAIEDGSYTGWDCPNEWYGGTPTELYGSIQCVAVEFTPLLDPRELVEEYAALPGLGYAEHKALDFDGPEWRAVQDGTTVHYVFDDRAGDCPAGCTYGTAYYLRSDAAGEATLVDQWDWGYGAYEAPSWYTDYHRCG